MPPKKHKPADKKPRGRPSKPENREFTEVLFVRISESEKAAIDAAAASNGLPTGTYVRLVLRQAMRANPGMDLLPKVE